jgi:UV DNA damage endonuclease
MSIGYACLLVGIPEAKLSSCTLKNATPDRLKEITGANLKALETMVDYNIRQGIRFFRISSDIVPFASHPDRQISWRSLFMEDFQRIGSKIKASGMRVTMHPGQYSVLNSPEERVVQGAIRELCYHTEFLDALGAGGWGKVILHIGGVYGDKQKAMEAFAHNYRQLPEAVKARLVIENDDKSYTLEDVLKVSRETAAPVVFDNLHHQFNPSLRDWSQVQLVRRCGETWKPGDGKQKIHYSQQQAGGQPGAHSPTIYIREFLDFYRQLEGMDVDVMLEVKDKNLSAVKCILCTGEMPPAKLLEEEWARYKYFVLSRSQRTYQQIRQLLKNKEKPDPIAFYEILEQVMLLEEDQGAQINAAQHVWGYVGKGCKEADKKRFQRLLKNYEEGSAKAEALKNLLFRLAREQQVEYLLQSIYFYL